MLGSGKVRCGGCTGCGWWRWELLLCAATPDLWAAFGNRSPVLTGLLIAVLCVFALGAGVLAGLFSVNADKAVETAASRIHGVGSVPELPGPGLCSPSGGAAGFSWCRRGQVFSLICFALDVLLFHPPLLWRTRAWRNLPAGPRRHMAAACPPVYVPAGRSGCLTAHSEIDHEGVHLGRPRYK